MQVDTAMLTVCRPVVVAENMIGVAMYELVRTNFEVSGTRLTSPRFKLVTITSSAKSFESKQTELQSKYTRRRVWDISGECARIVLIKYSWCYCRRPCRSNRKALVCRIGTWFDGNYL